MADNMTADIARLRERLPWIASQMRDSGMYTQATEIESIVPILTEIEGLRRDAEKAHGHLMNMQPHIAQLPERYRPFIDSHVDEAMKLLDAAKDAK